MAMSADYLKGIAPKFVLLRTIFQGCAPFLAMVFVTMFLVYWFPPLVYGLPNLFHGNYDGRPPKHLRRLLLKEVAPGKRQSRIRGDRLA